MKRRTLDIIFVVGGVAMAALLAVLGLVLKSNANFAKDYVKDQLSEQQITFTPAEKLVKADAWKAGLLNSADPAKTPTWKTFNGDQAAMEKFITDHKLVAEADSKCLNKYAGQLMTTGKMAECYAQYYIRLHLADGSIVDGKGYTYATITQASGAAQKAVDEATAANPNDPAIADLQKKVDGIKAQRETLFKGESLRGLLLTSYGFSEFGRKADQAAMVLFLIALVLLLASVAGLIHFLKTPKTALVGHHDTPASA